MLEQAPSMAARPEAMQTEDPVTADANMEAGDFQSADDGESDGETARMEESQAEEIAQFEALLAQEPDVDGAIGEEDVARALEQDPSLLGLA
eukprot:15471651-Alexandrium_andersonii.AAC.1